MGLYQSSTLYWFITLDMADKSHLLSATSDPQRGIVALPLIICEAL